MNMVSAQEREFDVVVWGATGFAGRLTAQYLLERYGTSLRWALGGRNRAKLEDVRDAIGAETSVDASALPLVVGDAADAASMRALAERTRVACTSVGPYALYGAELVAACAAAGTHYCDLTGELFWMGRMIDAHQDEAQASGARIVHTCGFDCIPADLGVFFLQREMQARHGVPGTRVKLRVAGFSGGVSGGTAATGINMFDEHPSDPGNNLRARLTGDREDARRVGRLPGAGSARVAWRVPHPRVGDGRRAARTAAAERGRDGGDRGSLALAGAGSRRKGHASVGRCSISDQLHSLIPRPGWDFSRPQRRLGSGPKLAVISSD